MSGKPLRGFGDEASKDLLNYEKEYDAHDDGDDRRAEENGQGHAQGGKADNSEGDVAKTSAQRS